MQSLHTILKDLVPQWRSELRESYPLWERMKVVTKGKPEAKRKWHFSTDLKKINALIFKDEELQKLFEEEVTKYWDGDAQELAEETLHYLLYHELYHPLEAPFSTKGDPNDKELIHQAIGRGLIKADPSMSPLEQVLKVGAAQNCVKDFILDNRFSLDNERLGYVRDDVIPVWDFIELQETDPKTDFYTITRFLYGVLYGPESVHDFFADKTMPEGVKAAYKALEDLTQQTLNVQRSEEDRSLVGKLEGVFKKTADTMCLDSAECDKIRNNIRTVFSSDDRYMGIERFIHSLASYIQAGAPQARCDHQGEASGSSMQDILQDLLGGMSQEEQQQFLTQLTQEIEGDPTGSAYQFSQGEENSVTSWEHLTDDLQSLELTALHEFYKRNHPQVTIIGGTKQGEEVVVGTKQRFVLQNSSVITQDQLTRLNLGRIARFQEKTRLPVLIQLDDGLYRLNEYSIKEQPVKDIVYVDESLDVPEIVEFYLDSSGSMYIGYGNDLGFNDGSRWDMLTQVLYGDIDALYQASKTLNKPCSIRINNVGSSQVSSRTIPIKEFWEKAPVDVLKVLFKPENGYNVEDLNITLQNDGKHRTYVVATDGRLCIDGRTARESRKMRQLAKQPQTDVILFEIGGTYSLGRAVANDPNIHYHQVHDKERMLEEGLEVMLAK
jgi:hypothetical protein